jgi:hypothetical protein
MQKIKENLWSEKEYQKCKIDLYAPPPSKNIIKLLSNEDGKNMSIKHEVVIQINS